MRYFNRQSDNIQFVIPIDKNVKESLDCKETNPTVREVTKPNFLTKAINKSNVSFEAEKLIKTGKYLLVVLGAIGIIGGMTYFWRQRHGKDRR